MSLSALQVNSDSGANRKAAEGEALGHIQKEMAGIFSDLADLLGNPSSLGSIYGLLFASTEALSMEEIVDRLGISTGTASQGLRRLTELKAIDSHKEDGERVTRYSARLELRPFVALFLEQQLMPRLSRSSARLSSLEESLPQISFSQRGVLKTRLHRAIKWHRLAGNLLPLIHRFINR